MTNACKNDCRYCGLRCTRDRRRTGYQVEELARTFTEMWRAGLVNGLFLSSSVPGDADATMFRMTAAAEVLRRRHSFRGYIHLKVLPGASRAAVEAAARVADRVSINLEAPSQSRLDVLSPDKDWATSLRARMDWIHEVTADPRFRARSHTTQFVVGAAGETDQEILTCTSACYRDTAMSRAYFSAYQPPDPDALPASAHPDVLTREHRLYQADWLMRKYAFALDDIPVDETGHLDIDRDPKQVWADRHPEFFPVEVNKASYQDLLRIPGVGPTTARRITRAREGTSIRYLRDLSRLKVVTRRASAYVLLGGRRPLSARQKLIAWA